MRYAQGGGLTAEGRRRWEQVRLAAVERFERRVLTAEIAAELRVSERSVQRWRRAWEAGGAPGLASRGQAARCRLDGDQLAELDRVQYTVPGTWYLLRRRGRSCQLGARRAAGRDDGAIEMWKEEAWPRVKAPRRPSAAGSSSRTRPASG